MKQNSINTIIKFFKKTQIQLIIQILTALILFHFLFFKKQNQSFTTLNDWQFWLFISSLLLTFIGGLILYRFIFKEENTLVSQIKKINRYYYYYIFFTFTGVASGYCLTTIVDKPSFFSFFILEAALIYMYITQWIKTYIWSNVIYSTILTLPFIGLAFLDISPLLPINEYEDKTLITNNYSAICFFALFLFIVYFIKSFVQNIIYSSNNIKNNKRTIAVKYNNKTAARFTSVLIIFCIISLIGILFYYSINYPIDLNINALYILLLISIPLFYCAFELWENNEKKSIYKINNVLNFTIWASIMSLITLNYI